VRAYWSLLINRNALPMRAGLTSRKPQHNAQCSREHHAAITQANNPQWYLLYLRDPMTQLPTRLRLAQSRETSHSTIELHHRMDPPWRNTCPNGTKARGRMCFLVKGVRGRSASLRWYFLTCRKSESKGVFSGLAYAMLRSQGFIGFSFVGEVALDVESEARLLSSGMYLSGRWKFLGHF
jgi:hypothetical protein